jgi:hypothetical protein
MAQEFRNDNDLHPVYIAPSLEERRTTAVFFFSLEYTIRLRHNKIVGH